MQVKACAVEVAKAIQDEDGVAGAVKAFYRHFPVNNSDDESEKSHHHRFSIRQCFGHRPH